MARQWFRRHRSTDALMAMSEPELDGYLTNLDVDQEPSTEAGRDFLFHETVQSKDRLMVARRDRYLRAILAIEAEAALFGPPTTPNPDSRPPQEARWPRPNWVTTEELARAMLRADPFAENETGGWEALSTDDRQERIDYAIGVLRALSGPPATEGEP